ncbi:MAG: hypothetical protein ACJ0K4_13080 [Verrucomicrobiales bacterium]
MTDSTPVDLSDLQLMPDWLKEPSKSTDSKAKHHDRKTRRNGDSSKKPFKRKNWERGKDRNRNRSADSKKGAQHIQVPQGINAILKPSEDSLLKIADQIKKTARAYSVFEIARLILADRERYNVSFECDESSGKELFSGLTDNSIWLSRDEAESNLIRTKKFSEFYNEETIEVDPPKGNFTSIATCGISGTLIGPPNHHSYQTSIAQLHRSNFANMPIERFKNKIRVEQNEEIIEEWKKEQSLQKQYTYKASVEGDENLVLKNKEEAEAHFLANHSDELIQSSKSAIVPGKIDGKKLSAGLLSLLKNASTHARKHPASLVNPLCKILGDQGLKFFKRGKKIFACVCRPKPISSEDTLSEAINAIVTFIRKNQRVTSKELIDGIAPYNINSENSKNRTTREDSTEANTSAGDGEEANLSSKNATTDESSEAETNLGPEQIQVLKDLNWLLREGAVIAFGDGKIELAKAKPPKTDQGKTEKHDGPSRINGNQKTDQDPKDSK